MGVMSRDIGTIPEIIGLIYVDNSTYKLYRVSQTTRTLSFSRVPFLLEAWNKKSVPYTKSALPQENILDLSPPLLGAGLGGYMSVSHGF